MRNLWDLGALARAAGSKVFGGALPQSVAAVGTDSRSLPPESLFVALRGERFDGHDFVAAAVARGARAVMVDRAGEAKAARLPVPRLVVDDTLRALGEMARAARASLGRPVVAVTGSNGKTTTKEMLAAILGERGPVHKTSGNLNNLIGLPLTILAWPEDAWAAVLEMGMNIPGEIARLTEIAAPDVGVITMVGAAHLSGLGSIEAVAAAKGELYAGLGSAATAVVNADDERILHIAVPRLRTNKRLTFGRAADADVRLCGHEHRDGRLRVRLAVAGEEIEAALPLLGPHNAVNAAAAAATAHALGLRPEEIARGLATVSVPGGRLRLVTSTAGLHILDDTYNANPASMVAAIDALASIATGRKLAVLGDMLELGDASAALHREVGLAAGRSGIAEVFALGADAAALADGVREAGGRAQAYTSVEALLGDLDRTVATGDWIVIKGSRGMKMERVVVHLTEKG